MSHIAKFAVVLNLLTGVMTSRLPDDVKFKRRDSLRVHFSNIHRDEKSYVPFPSSFTIHFTTRERNVTLELKQNELVHAPSIPMYTKQGRLPTASESMLRYYQDVENMAAIELECEEINCQKYHVLGSLILDNEHFVLQKSSYLTDLEDSYELLQSHPVPGYGLDYMMTDSGVKTQQHDDTTRYKRATGTYIVELLLVIDYSIYQFWFGKNSAITNIADRRLAAMDNIKQYYGFFMNGIDVRYKNLPGASFQMNVVFAGIYISETSSDSPYTAHSVNNIIEATTTLNAFSSWANINRATLPAHDHAMLFTRLDIARNGSTSTKGYAYTGTMCSANAQSIVEEDFDFIVQTTGAHELGHGLNALHDGDANSCDGNSGYIMASVSQIYRPTDARRRNPWIFSSCSVSYINNYLNILSPNCLLTVDSSDTTGLNRYTATPIGQTYSPDEQCVYKFGTGSFFGRGFYNSSNLDTICTSMYCKDPTNTRFYKLMVPGYGTSCGNKKWCVAGQCVSSSLAPSVTESCPFGDSPDNAITGGCSAFIKQSPWACYSANSFASCCSSCQSIKTNTPGCEFGDRTDCSVITAGFSCYSATNENLCCSTCKKFETGRADCKYGDRSICTSVIAPACYSNEAQCCDHCYEYQTGIPNCTYGDKAFGCTQNSCALNVDTCCQTCYTGTTTTSTTTLKLTTTQKTTIQTVPKTSTIISVTTQQKTTVGETTTLPEQQTTKTEETTKSSTILPAPTTTQSTGFLSNWVLPVAAAGSSVLVILILIFVFFCWKRQSKSKPTTPRSSMKKQQLSYIKHTSYGGPYVVYDNPMMQRGNGHHTQSSIPRTTNGSINKDKKANIVITASTSKRESQSKASTQGYSNQGFVAI